PRPGSRALPARGGTGPAGGGHLGTPRTGRATARGFARRWPAGRCPVGGAADRAGGSYSAGRVGRADRAAEPAPARVPRPWRAAVGNRCAMRVRRYAGRAAALGAGVGVRAGRPALAAGVRVAGAGFEPAKLSRLIYSQLPLAARETRRVVHRPDDTIPSSAGVGDHRPALPTSMKETAVAKDSSFDIVSTVDRQEVDNAVNQTAKEISQRYDFKGVGASIAWNGTEAITMKANAADRVRAVLDVFQSKLIRRGVSLKAVDTGQGDPEQSGQEYRLTATLREGLAGQQAKKITKIIRDQGPKGVKTQINGEE